MKNLSKTAWLILGIGIFVIAMGGLFVVYRGQAAEQERLNTRLTAAQNALPPLISEKEDLEGQLTALEVVLAEAKSSLSKAKMVFPRSVESIEYDEVLFSIADDWDLKIIRLTASEPSDKDVEGILFSETSFTVEVQGEVDDILTYIHTIANDSHFVSATVELEYINVPEPLSEEEKGELTTEEIEEKEKPSASIKLVVYGYKGE